MPDLSVPLSLHKLSSLQCVFFHHARDQVVQMSNSLTPGPCKSSVTPGKKLLLGSDWSLPDNRAMACRTTDEFVPTF